MEQCHQVKRLSRQQINELRIIVFQLTYKWYDSLGCVGGLLGLALKKDEHLFLDGLSPKQSRQLVWRCFEKHFKLQGSYLDFPRDRYREAKTYLKSLTLESVYAMVPKSQRQPDPHEWRPGEVDLRRRFDRRIQVRQARSIAMRSRQQPVQAEI